VVQFVIAVTYEWTGEWGLTNKVKPGFLIHTLCALRASAGPVYSVALWSARPTLRVRRGRGTLTPDLEAAAWNL